MREMWYNQEERKAKGVFRYANNRNKIRLGQE